MDVYVYVCAGLRVYIYFRCKCAGVFHLIFSVLCTEQKRILHFEGKALPSHNIIYLVQLPLPM